MFAEITHVVAVPPRVACVVMPELSYIIQVTLKSVQEFQCHRGGQSKIAISHYFTHFTFKITTSTKMCQLPPPPKKKNTTDKLPKVLPKCFNYVWNYWEVGGSTPLSCRDFPSSLCYCTLRVWWEPWIKFWERPSGTCGMQDFSVMGLWPRPHWSQWHHASGAWGPHPFPKISLFMPCIVFTWTWTSFFWVVSLNCVMPYSNSALQLPFLSALSCC